MQDYYFLLLLLLRITVIYIYECVRVYVGRGYIRSKLPLSWNSGVVLDGVAGLHAAVAVSQRQLWAVEAIGLRVERPVRHLNTAWEVISQSQTRQRKPWRRGLPPQTSWPYIAPPLSGNSAGWCRTAPFPAKNCSCWSRPLVAALSDGAHGESYHAHWGKGRHHVD